METDTIRRDNPRHQGDIGVAVALGYFLAQGYRVALPLGESQPWDLVIEDPEENRPERVQVKTTTHVTPYGTYQVQIRTCGGNQSWNGLVRRFDPDEVEWLFVLTDAWESYLIPSTVITAQTKLSLGPKMAPYRLDTPQLQLPL